MTSPRTSRTSRPLTRARRARRAVRRTLVGTTTVVALAVGGVWAVGKVLDSRRAEPEPRHTCWASVNGDDWYLSPEQAQNVALFSAMATERGLPARAVTIATATALQESWATNIDYGDRDSVGLFQQRPSQGWGTVEQIMDPVYSTGKFYDGLVKVRDYTKLEVTVAAQTVQRSAFPDAYAKHEGKARAWASALAAQDGTTLTCELRPSLPGGDPQAFAARADRDWPSASVTADATTRTVRISPGKLGADDGRTLTRLARWAVAVADEGQVVQVAVGDQVWERSTSSWRTVTPSEGTSPSSKADAVTVTLAP
ncbi:hypothetical protein [Sanguibacter sp. HDW7]|uniref:hypothetical protein n=1 Tax=Sanguibacter sp. HDW7 TaxID=2714931 RepID=UPI001981CAA7|nr:hypothetical protein [Sanguibacter sp. HDW7]